MTATNSSEELPPVWFDPGIALGQIRTCFQEAKAEIRIASGFFTLRGWGMIRRFTKDKKVYLLVGIDEPADDRAKMALVNDIIRDLATGWDRDRRQSVQDLIEKIEARGFHIVDARARAHHAKLYLVDRTIAITTSANTTGRDLIGQIEAGHVNRIQKEVTSLVEKFDAHFADAIDITQALLDDLKRWLELVSPWDICELMPEARVAVTIDEFAKDNYKMKETKEIENAIAKFAPRANNAEGKFKDTFDIFISTDAYGVGVNMQDAQVVVNYDIDWTPINPIQRAGRILRFDDHPRDVSLYTFIPKLTQQTPISRELDIARRWETLFSRHDEARKLIDLPVLTTSTSQEINLPEMASSVTIRAGKLSMEDFGDVDISPFYQHTANLQLHRTDANMLRSDITSAKLYN